jgi:DNA primase
LCPFHDDHNPSLRVYPDRQSFRCWVCAAGGDCFSFVQQRERVEFREALEILAQRAGVLVPARRRAPTAGAPHEKARLLEALLWAQRQFLDALRSDAASEPARRYLAERGFTQQTLDDFHLGFHPNDWSWILQRARGRFTPELLAAAGLVKPRDGETGHFDYFVNRVMFPIHNERGQPVGFGGRVLPGEDSSFGKYFNSHENAVFHKSRLLYALNHARDAMKPTETAIVVEGYTDCITAHQAGLKNVVATLGTALTEMQVTTIKRFARKVVLVYDGDQAGQDASLRAVSRFLSQDLDLRILTLPAGQDPADYIGRHGAESFQRLIDQAPEAFDFAFDTLRNKYGLTTVDGRQRILSELMDLLAAVPRLARNVRQDLLLQRTAERLGIAEEVVRRQYQEWSRPAPRRSAAPSPAQSRIDAAETPPHVQRLLRGQPTRDDRLECELLQCLLAAPQWTSVVRREIVPEDLQNPTLRTILQVCFDVDERGGPTRDGSPILLALAGQEPVKQVVVWLGEQAERKCLQDRLREAGTIQDSTIQETTTTVDCPHLLRRAIDNLVWRREEQSHQRTAQALSAQCEGARALNAETEHLLRQFSNFHQKRATK